MKRLSVCMLFGCVCALGLGVLSCEAAEQKTRTLTDANGREVELNEDIQRRSYLIATIWRSSGQ